MRQQFIEPIVTVEELLGMQERIRERNAKKDAEQKKRAFAYVEMLRLSKQRRRKNQSVFRAGTSKYKGVVWDKQKKRWHVGAYGLGVNYFLGYFDNEKDAAKAYDEAAIAFWGKGAYTNQKQFPEDFED